MVSGRVGFLAVFASTFGEASESERGSVTVPASQV